MAHGQIGLSKTLGLVCRLSVVKSPCHLVKSITVGVTQLLVGALLLGGGPGHFLAQVWLIFIEKLLLE